MAKKKQKDDLSAIRKSLKSTPKDLDAIKKIALGKQASEKPVKVEKVEKQAVQSPIVQADVAKKDKKVYHRTTISLQVSTYKLAKKHCIDIGQTLTEYITTLIEKDIQ